MSAKCQKRKSVSKVGSSASVPANGHQKCHWRKSLPCVAHHALASVAAGDVREFAFERRRRRPAVDPLHFSGTSQQRRLSRLPRAVDDKARPGRVWNVAPMLRSGLKSCAAAQGEDRVRHSERFVGAPAEFAASVGDALGVIGEREDVAADDCLLGVVRQFERRKPPGGIRRPLRLNEFLVG